MLEKCKNYTTLCDFMKLNFRIFVKKLNLEFRRMQATIVLKKIHYKNERKNKKKKKYFF